MFQLDDDFDIDVNFLDDALKSGDPQSSESNKSFQFEFDQPEKRPRLDPSSSVEFLSPQRDSVSPLPSEKSSFFNFDSPFKDDGRNFSSRIFENKKVVARKFPGPAGLLPQRQANTSLVASNDFLTQLEQVARPEIDELPTVEEVLSQGSACFLQSEAWKCMESALGAEGKSLLSAINLASVHERAKAYRGQTLRIPFLAVSVSSIDASNPDPSVKFQDTSGEMFGALHRVAWEILNDSLVSGSVLVLNGACIVPASITNYYINVTSKNIVAVFSPTDKDVKETRVNELGDCTSLLESWHRGRIPPPLPSTCSSQPLQQASPHGERSWRQTPPRPLRSQAPSTSVWPRFQAGMRSPSPRFLLPTKSTGPKVPQPDPGRFLKTQPIQECSRELTGRTQKSVNLNNQPRRTPVPSTSSSVLSPKVRTIDNDPLNQSIVESLLEGIDTDSLFGDF